MSGKSKPKKPKQGGGWDGGFINALTSETASDPVNHPSHYADGKIECIDAIDTVTASMPGELGYYTGTILKYVWRWNKKNGVQDLKKARWYLNRLILKLDPTDKGV